MKSEFYQALYGSRNEPKEERAGLTMCFTRMFLLIMTYIHYDTVIIYTVIIVWKEKRQ